MSATEPAAVIVGCAGPDLTPAERAFIAADNPFGLILFKRNVDTPERLRRLTDDFRALTGRADAPILIDQEGGRVQRLTPPHWTADPAPGRFSEAARGDLDLAARAIQAFAVATALDLREVGVSVNAVPCLDRAVPGQSTVIGDRALGREGAEILPLAAAMVDGYRAAGIQPIMKHLPGHGRATVDSHLALPTVTASLAELAADMLPFAAFARDGATGPALPWAMTAHVVFTAIDPTRPATLSPRVVEGTIREEIGFDGLLVTDDLTMGALSGPVSQRAAAALAAGCDVALHCAGTVEEYAETVEKVGTLSAAAVRRWETALAWAGTGDPEVLGAGRDRWRREGQDCLDRALRAAAG